MLGIAARSSIALPTGLLIQGGANSTKKSAMARLKGRAMTMAIKVDTSVPKILLAAPKFPVTGFQAFEKRNPIPNFLSDRLEPIINCIKIPAIRTKISAESKAAAHLNILSVFVCEKPDFMFLNRAKIMFILKAGQ